MSIILMILAAAVLLLAAAYAQYRIPRYTVGGAKVALARGVLGVTGLMLGALFAARYPDSGIRTLLAFLIGFGGVHVPAAVILFLKRAQGTGKS